MIGELRALDIFRGRGADAAGDGDQGEVVDLKALRRLITENRW